MIWMRQREIGKESWSEKSARKRETERERFCGGSKRENGEREKACVREGEGRIEIARESEVREQGEESAVMAMRTEHGTERGVEEQSLGEMRRGGGSRRGRGEPERQSERAREQESDRESDRERDRESEREQESERQREQESKRAKERSSERARARARECGRQRARERADRAREREKALSKQAALPVWESKALRASLEDWQSWNPAHWNLDTSEEPLSEAELQRNVGTGHGWDELCEPEQEPEYNEVNNTLARMMMSDPTLLPHPSGSIHGDFSVIFSSYPPEAHRPGCKWTLNSAKQVTDDHPHFPAMCWSGMCDRHWQSTDLHHKATIIWVVGTGC
eukprot:884897-Rhodomonas_salina.2